MTSRRWWYVCWRQLGACCDNWGQEHKSQGNACISTPSQASYQRCCQAGRVTGPAAAATHVHRTSESHKAAGTTQCACPHATAHVMTNSSSRDNNDTNSLTLAQHTHAHMHTTRHTLARLAPTPSLIASHSPLTRTQPNKSCTPSTPTSATTLLLACCRELPVHGLGPCLNLL